MADPKMQALLKMLLAGGRIDPGGADAPDGGVPMPAPVEPVESPEARRTRLFLEGLPRTGPAVVPLVQKRRAKPDVQALIAHLSR
jgi:hypothetical protein